MTGTGPVIGRNDPDAREIATRFGLGRVTDLAGPVARGETGEVWRLTAGGRRYAVKRTRPGFVDRLTDERAEQIVAFATQAVRRGVPTPTARRTTDGRLTVRSDGLPVRVHDWVDLDPPDWRLDPGRVGRLLAALHRTDVPADGPVGWWFTAPVGADRWDALIGRLRDAGAAAADELAALRDDLVALEAGFVAVPAVQTCHLDLWADNVLGTASGELCVIDWDNCGPGDPSQELAFCVAEFARGDGRRARRLVEAYAGAGGPGRLRGPGDFTVVGAVLGHIAEMWADRRLAATTEDERVASDAALAEFCADPVTPVVVDRLLAAVADLG